MQGPVPLTRDLVLVGGGHAHALVLRMFGMDPMPGLRITVIDPNPAAPYTGMLPGHIAGHYPREALEIDLVKLARFAGARLVLARATGLDRAARRVMLEGRPPVFYDLLSLDIGVTSAMPELEGFADHAVPAKPLDRYADRWAAFLDALAPSSDVPVAVLGGGVAGVELAMAMDHALNTRGHRPAVSLIDAGTALAAPKPRTRALLLNRLSKAGITLFENARARAVESDAVVLEDGRRIASAFTLGAAGARPYPWLADTGLETQGGYVVTDATLRSPTDAAIFAVGDCSHFAPDPRPKAGVYAVRAAPVLHHNLRAALSSGTFRAFKPQRDYLKLISLGEKAAAAEKFGLSAATPALWRLKDRIDRAFIAKLAELPAMPRPAVPKGAAAGVAEEMGGAPLCGGCGAKVGPEALAAALAALPATPREDLETGPGDDAAVLRFAGTRQVLTTDHLRAFTNDPWLFARIAAVHALGDVWAMGAAPQAALASITLPQMRPHMQAETLREILDAANGVFREAGVALAGGHTSLGSELSLGFTVTGLAEAPIRLSGARPGDALILTKPLGTGALLAAEMAGHARGRDVAAALTGMATPQGAAAALLQGAHAMTDVTGFGLAGHLLGICTASGTSAALTLDALPLYPGARAAVRDGHLSVLAPANRAATAGAVIPPATELGEMLFDPQTGGGLLAAVDPDTADALVEKLRDAGFPAAARIGEIRAGPPRIDIVDAAER